MEEVSRSELICESPATLGHGHLDGIVDLVVVDKHRFDRAQSQDCALAVAQFNRRLTQEGRPYILVGVGRWGSTHSWLGIPVRWADISGAQVIIEAGFKDFPGHALPGYPLLSEPDLSEHRVLHHQPGNGRGLR